MADAPDAAEHAAKGSLEFLKHKVGPLPLGVWLAIGIALLYYFRSQQAKTATGPAQQTDPAGNVGTIDPATGYVYGSPSDQAALSANNAGSGDTSVSNATSGAQTYADNNAWGRAAINLLVGDGVDPTTANQAIQQYLNSLPLTSAQQGDVNLAIQALGPPPTLPGPTTTNPPPVTTPPGSTTVTVPKVTGMTATAAVAALAAAGLVAGSEGKNGGPGIVNSQTPGAGQKAPVGSTVDLGLAKSGSGGGGGKSVPAPTGLVVSAKSGHSLRVKWNRSNGATGYYLKCTDMASKQVAGRADVGASTLTFAFTNLQARHSYVVDVWAEPEAGAKGSGPHAEVSTTLPAK